MRSRRVRGRDRPKLPQTTGEVPDNQLLALLPSAVRARLALQFESIYLSAQEIVFRAHEPYQAVYFPNTAVISFVCTLESGQALEVGLVGRDGMAGIPAFPGVTTMPCDGIVQVPGVAQRMSVEALRQELASDAALHSVLGGFAQLLLARSMQMSICNVFHSTAQRCARWLLTVSDLLSSPDVPLTHELLSTMLGVHRPTVTLAVRALHRAGLVTEKRGLLVITDRRGLEQASCECFGVMRLEQRRLIGY